LDSAFFVGAQQAGYVGSVRVFCMRGPWDCWIGRLSEKDKYEITSWAFSFFMKSNLTVSDAVAEAVRTVKPQRLKKDGALNLSKADLLELQLRVKNML
jgi:hypothetical protein